MKFPKTYPKILQRCSWSSPDGKCAGPLKKAVKYGQRGDDLLLSSALWSFGGEALGEALCEKILKCWTLVWPEVSGIWEWRVADQVEFLRLSMDPRQLQKCREVLKRVKAFYQRIS